MPLRRYHNSTRDNKQVFIKIFEDENPINNLLPSIDKQVEHMSINRKPKAENFDSETTIETPTIHTPAAPK